METIVKRRRDDGDDNDKGDDSEDDVIVDKMMLMIMLMIMGMIVKRRHDDNVVDNINDNGDDSDDDFIIDKYIDSEDNGEINDIFTTMKYLFTPIFHPEANLGLMPGRKERRIWSCDGRSVDSRKKSREGKIPRGKYPPNLT